MLAGAPTVGVGVTGTTGDARKLVKIECKGCLSLRLKGLNTVRGLRELRQWV